MVLVHSGVGCTHFSSNQRGLHSIFVLWGSLHNLFQNSIA